LESSSALSFLTGVEKTSPTAFVLFVFIETSLRYTKNRARIGVNPAKTRASSETRQQNNSVLLQGQAQHRIPKFDDRPSRKALGLVAARGMHPCTARHARQRPAVRLVTS
jgi:hypothetical protein